MPSKEIPIDNEQEDSKTKSLANLGPRQMEVFGTLQALLEKVDRSKINIEELEETAESLLVVFAGKAAGKIDMVSAVAVIDIILGYAAIAGGADIAPSKRIPDDLKYLGDKLKTTKTYTERIFPRADNLANNIKLKRERLQLLRQKLEKYK